jgi:hypothetical protein
MFVMIFLIGLLIGVLGGGALCVRYLRQEIAADIGPRLKRVQMKLESLETEVNLALATRLADLSGAQRQIPPSLAGDRDDPYRLRDDERGTTRS